jgi:hypothetical protein
MVPFRSMKWWRKVVQSNAVIALMLLSTALALFLNGTRAGAFGRAVHGCLGAWLLTVPALFPPLSLYPASAPLPSPPLSLLALPTLPLPAPAPALLASPRFPYPTSSCPPASPPASRSPSLPFPCTADRRGTQYTSEICAVIRCTLCGSKITVGLSTAVRFDCRYLGGCEPAEVSRHVCERCGASPIDGLPCYTHSRLLRVLNGYTPPNSSFAHAVPQHPG